MISKDCIHNWSRWCGILYLGGKVHHHRQCDKCRKVESRKISLDELRLQRMSEGKLTNKAMVLASIKKGLTELSHIAMDCGMTEESVLSAVRNLQYYNECKISVETRKVKFIVCRGDL